MATVGTAGSVAVGQRFLTADMLRNLLRPVGAGYDRAALGTATVDDWSLQVGSLFTAHTGHVLRLVDVQRFPEKGMRPAGLRKMAFVARFDVARGGALPGDKTYTFAHPKGGTFNMFLNSGPPSKPLRMLAVFN